MISLLHLNKFLAITFSLFLLILNFSFAEEDKPSDIWEKNETESEASDNLNQEKKITIESPILSEDINKITININEQQINEFDHEIVGLFDPEENNFNLNMWSQSDGEDIKKIMKRINKLKLSKFSEDLFFQVLFTNAYPPKNNLTSKEFVKMKIDWLIKKKRFDDLEKVVLMNPGVGKETKAIKFLVNESLAINDIKSACKKVDSLEKSVENNYLEKFKIYCLINNDRKDEAILVFDLLKERGFKDKFFEDKINFLLNVTSETTQKILDDNLLNFYLSHITTDNFKYEPDEKTDKYIWRYLSSANLIKTEDFENEDIILTYEQAAASESLDSSEVFEIYLRMSFNFNQLRNSTEVYKNLPNYKARALIYQSLLLSDDVERKLKLAFLLKELFIKDKLKNVYSEELSNILNKIETNKIPETYVDLVNENLELNKKSSKKIKFDNDILHRSKVIKHFLQDSNTINKTEKDFRAVYKKIKRNKKYFFSIRDIVVMESLIADGLKTPNDLDYEVLLSDLTVPENLMNLAKEDQMGLLMLKIIEIIGEDNVKDLDPETIYFLIKILNDLDLKKIRNNILSEALPVRV